MAVPMATPWGPIALLWKYMLYTMCLVTWAHLLEYTYIYMKKNMNDTAIEDENGKKRRVGNYPGFKTYYKVSCIGTKHTSTCFRFRNQVKVATCDIYN